MILWKTCYDGNGGEKLLRVHINNDDVLDIVSYGENTSPYFPRESCIVVMKDGQLHLVDRCVGYVQAELSR